MQVLNSKSKSNESKVVAPEEWRLAALANLS